MEARDFLYHYTDKFFFELIKETILIENWEERDFDFRYAEYADVFQDAKKKYLEQPLTETEFLDYLKQKRMDVAGKFNKQMLENFTAEFKRYRLDRAVHGSLLSQNLFFDDKISTTCLRDFRAFEEKFFPDKPIKGVP